MDIEDIMSDYEKKRQMEYERFMNKCASKITDGDLIYRLLALGICKRFKLKLDYTCSPPDVVYAILNHYVEEVDEDFEEWLNKEDAPMIRRASELKRIFPEIASFTESNREIVEVANEIYGLNLELYSERYEEEYIYSLSFDFNSFVPIDISRIREIKEELAFCKKYGVENPEMEEELKSFGLSDEQLDKIGGDD